MRFLPLDRMWNRVEIAEANNDDDLFRTLMLYGENVLKLVTVGLSAFLEDEHERYRYRVHHGLVRADSLGEWASTLNDLLSGLPSQQLKATAAKEWQELAGRRRRGTWQYDSVQLLHECLLRLQIEAGELPDRVTVAEWFGYFVTLRNRTRGHGAPHSSECAALCPGLKKTMELVSKNLSLFGRPWAVLRRNLSGKYRVTPLTPDSTPYEELKQSTSYRYPDGVYVYLDGMHHVELLVTTPEAQDFYLPNGRFHTSGFELLSYVSARTQTGDHTKYMQPAEQLPGSETQGKGELEVQGNCLANLPPLQEDYVERKSLEEELMHVLRDDRHPVVTLVGRGGIGKTWLALRVLHRLAACDRFAKILWFSARDIDLLPQGPKQVRPHILNQTDLAKEYVRLVEFEESPPSAKEATKRFVQDLQAAGPEPSLFVLDNFETVRNPVELYTWLDTYIRSPNKILITTRFREFKGDYPVEVVGMVESECQELIDSTVKRLGIGKLVSRSYRAELVKESDGHPYVIRILLGEIAKTKKASTPRRIIAGKDDILDALFERTFSGLSPAAKRIFLTLSCWHSTAPVLGLEAALLREENERMDVQGGLDELVDSSMVEIGKSTADDQLFVSIPLVALSFGEKKLLVSPMKSAIQADLEILQAFGAMQQSGIQHGILPRVRRLFRFVATQVEENPSLLQEHTPMLEFVSRRYPEAWLMLAELQEEHGALEPAKQSVRRYLEQEPSGSGPTWTRLQNLCVKTEDWLGQAHALLETSELPEADLNTTSSCANTLNWLLHEGKLRLDTDEKRVVMSRMARLMEERIEESDAAGDDYSRLAWLYLHLGRKGEANSCATDGLQVDPQNEHCLRLLDRLRG